MAQKTLRIQRLSDCPEAIPELTKLLIQTWPDWYGPHGPGNPDQDLAGYANPEPLPFGLVAFSNDTVCAFAGLKTDAISGYEHLQPWAGTALVQENLRNKGIGSQLLRALQKEARTGVSKKYMPAPARPETCCNDSGWQAIGTASHNGETIHVYEKTLSANPTKNLTPSRPGTTPTNPKNTPPFQGHKTLKALMARFRRSDFIRSKAGYRQQGPAPPQQTQKNHHPFNATTPSRP